MGGQPSGSAEALPRRRLSGSPVSRLALCSLRVNGLRTPLSLCHTMSVCPFYPMRSYVLGYLI